MFQGIEELIHKVLGQAQGSEVRVRFLSSEETKGKVFEKVRGVVTGTRDGTKMTETGEHQFLLRPTKRLPHGIS